MGQIMVLSYLLICLSWCENSPEQE